MTILWNEVTIWWNEVTKGWNEVAWNEVVMEQSDRNSKNSLAEIANIGNKLKEFAVLHERSRFVVSAEKLLELSGSNYTMGTAGHACSGPLHMKTASGNLQLFSKCTNGHSKKRMSSEVLPQTRN